MINRGDVKNMIGYHPPSIKVNPPPLIDNSHP